MTQPAEDPLVAQAFDAKKHEDLARAIEKLNPEEAAFFLHKLEMAIRKRKIQITGYLVAMAVWLVGMVLALAYTGMHDGFVGWVFVAPFGGVGLVLYVFGRWANSVSKRPPPASGAAPAASDRPRGPTIASGDERHGDAVGPTAVDPAKTPVKDDPTAPETKKGGGGGNGGW